MYCVPNKGLARNKKTKDVAAGVARRNTFGFFLDYFFSWGSLTPINNAKKSAIIF
jgi:hypothetical protein